MRLRKLLCAVDFSTRSRAAVELAIGFARRDDAELTLLHVDNPPSYVLPDGGHVLPAPGALNAYYERIDRRLVELREHAAAGGVAHVRTVLGQGDPWKAIVAAAEAGEYDLVFLGTRGRSGLGHLFLGSVAEQVIRHASCPVVTVREGAHVS